MFAIWKQGRDNHHLIPAAVAAQKNLIPDISADPSLNTFMLHPNCAQRQQNVRSWAKQCVTKT